MKKINTLKLEKEEKQILAGIEAGNFKSVPLVKKEISRHAGIAKATLAKTDNISKKSFPI